MCPVQPPSSYPERAGTKRSAKYFPYVGVRIGETTGVDRGFQRFVQGVKVDLDIDKLSYAELYVDNINVQLTDDINWAEGQLMQLFLGYANLPERVKLQGSFRMSNPKFEFGGRKRISIRGIGDGAPMTNVARRRVFENMTYDQIVQKVAEEYRYDSLISTNLKDTIPSVTQAGISDYEFLKELAFRAGTDFFVFSSQLFFMIPTIRPNDEPIVVDVASDAVKNLTFSVMGDGKAAELSASPINPMTGEFEVVSSKTYTDGVFDVNTKNQLGFQSLASPRLVYMDGRGNLLSSSALQTMLDSEAAKRKNVVKVSGIMDGYEQLAPRKMMLFLNCGSRFRGPYYITRVVHEIAGQGATFLTRFEGFRATTGGYQRTMQESGAFSTGGTPEPLTNVSQVSQAEV